MMIGRNKLGQVALLFMAMLIAIGANATTYYVDYTNGSDTNNGTSKSSPWKFAPGMNNCASNCTGTTLNAGDQVILKGGVTWPNAAFAWVPPGGASGTVTYTVDQTWFAGSSWTRPIMDLGNLPPNNNGAYSIVTLNKSNVTLDNFEWTNIAALPSSVNGFTTLFAWGSTADGSTNDHVTNMYIHGWKNPYFSVGTGNLTNGSYTITNYVPYSYSPSPAAGWTSCGKNCQVQLQSVTGNVPPGNSSPTLTGLSGSNPYTLTFSNTTGPATANCTGCVIQMGADVFHINGGDPGPENNESFENNVIDGSDTAEVQINPYGDCGLTEGNNQFCIGSGAAGWRVPNIWRNNVIRFVSNLMIGGCQEWSGNLAEYLRLSTDPTAHTNGVECTSDFPVSNQSLFYNNVIRHGTNPNPSTPSGRQAIGLGAIQPSPAVGETVYVFNNVFYDVLQNAVFERGSNTGSQVIFNNTVDCGTSWSITSVCVSPVNAADIFQNNLLITTNTAVPGCSNCTTNLTQSATTANGRAYATSETYAYSPANVSGSTVGAGTTILNSTFCYALSGAAQAACQSDTTYGVGYNASAHSVVAPARTTAIRPAVPDIGAYQFAGSTQQTTGSTQPLPPAGLTATVQ